jgi:hypothetical protein
MDDDYGEMEYLTRDEALTIAQTETTRGLVVTDDSIKYIGFVAEYGDYCYSEFIREEEGWVMVRRLLTNAERHPGEEISNDSILQFARTGNLISAIRLYRAKHEVGLLEGKQGVELLLQQAPST